MACILEKLSGIHHAWGTLRHAERIAILKELRQQIQERVCCQPVLLLMVSTYPTSPGLRFSNDLRSRQAGGLTVALDAMKDNAQQVRPC